MPFPCGEKTRKKSPILFLPNKYYSHCVWMCESKGHPFLSYNQPLERSRPAQQVAGFSNHRASCGTGCQWSAGKQKKQAYRKVSLLPRSLFSPSHPQSLLSCLFKHYTANVPKQTSAVQMHSINTIGLTNSGC